MTRLKHPKKFYRNNFVHTKHKRRNVASSGSVLVNAHVNVLPAFTNTAYRDLTERERERERVAMIMLRN